MSKFRFLLISFIVLVFAGVLLKSFVSFERIDAGTVGIKVNLVGDERGVDDITVCTGWVAYMPLFTEIHEFPTSVQNKDYEPFTINAKDGQTFTVDPNMSYRVVKENVPSIFRKYRVSLDVLENTYLRNVIRNCYRDVLNRYVSDSLISNRPIFEGEVQQMIQKTFEPEGFVLEQLTSGLQAPESLTEAIEKKNRTIQEALDAQNYLQKAKAEAEAKVITAEAEKKVNDLKSAALTPLIIKQMYIEKWDGHLPTYGQVPTMFMDVTK
ncbi:MAG: prohibitin family protein [Paludibacteraceae bacterium]|nr:prohibitin family protein [Paludibacteraceae bacterium]